ncbi:MAG: hypothetical protein QGI08_00125 [Paracoccaceae bacterium]|jgi:hypothetical protein|nr:hypothetical protein [Paracoccaceae bacterium]MDP7184108.1 hypothetical protein [Paracoccaceae bacterium]
MRSSNYLTSIEWDLNRALIAKEKIEELFIASLRARNEAAEILAIKNEDLREVSILRTNFLQEIGELQEELFPTFEDMENWATKHQ